MHQSSVAARAVTQQYYGKEAYKNYYLGCSTGGRQGLASITLYPEDFDGVVRILRLFDF
jgi:feruloyl esterase